MYFTADAIDVVQPITKKRAFIDIIVSEIANIVY